MEHISLRDWLAGQALAGILADPQTEKNSELTTVCAYIYADAMLKARNKKKEYPKKEKETKFFIEHMFDKDDICKECGCSKEAVKHFNWRCP